MKLFLTKVLKFTVFSIIVVFGLYLLILILYLDKLDDQRLDEKVNTLILGDSQTQTAFNDSLYDNTVNFSHNSEHYLITYDVLKLIYKNNPQIKTLILGCTYHSFSGFYERCLFNEDGKADIVSHMLYTRYFTMLENKNKLLLIKKNFTGVLKSSQIGIKNMTESLIKNYSNYKDYEFIGKYYHGSIRTLDEEKTKASILWHFYKNDNEAELEDFSSFQLEYLIKILDFCRENDIRVFLLNTPMHETYLKQIPEKFLSRYYSILKDLEKSEKVTLLLDYPDCDYPDDYFGDSNHLNRKGASVFTRVIMNEVNKDQ